MGLRWTNKPGWAIQAGERVHLAQLRLRDFRNYQKLDAEFAPGFHVFLGDNAQGKTNLLEALYFVATLRSFRGVGNAHMVRQGAPGFFVGGRVLAQTWREIKIYWSLKRRTLSLDHQSVRRLTDYLGVLRAVVFCSEDMQLIKGAARGRRRFLDLLLSQTHPQYLPTLQRYAQAVRARNILLKAHHLDEAALDGFTSSLVALGGQLYKWRHAFIPQLVPLAQAAYRRITNETEELNLRYLPSIKNDYVVELTQARHRERAMRTTLLGPHRDELEIQINGRNAAQYASEGQKRSVALALKMAQAEYLTQLTGTPPVLLIDDVMGELDLRRRSAFLPLLEHSHHAHGQVFMTCTEENWPRELGRTLFRWHVAQGNLTPL